MENLKYCNTCNNHLIYDHIDNKFDECEECFERRLYQTFIRKRSVLHQAAINTLKKK